MLAGPYDGYVKTRLDGLSRRSGQLLEILDSVIKGGAAEWGDDVTYIANETIKQPTIIANNFTVNAGITLSTTALMPLIVIADTVDIAGIIATSGKGCQTSATRVDPTKLPMMHVYQEETSGLANYCLCGAGGAVASSLGGGAFGPSNHSATASSCDLSAEKLKQLLLSPWFDILQIGCGGAGNNATVGSSFGGGPILIVARLITLAATASVLANGLDVASGNCGGGGGGFVGLIADILTVHGSATVSASGGALGGTGENGGDGAIAQIEV